MASDGFFQQAFNFTDIPIPGWTIPAIVGVVSAVNELVHWKFGRGLSTADYIGAAVQIPSWLVAAYISSMAIIHIQLSWSGFIRFALSIVALLSPVIIGVAGILLLLPSAYKSLVLSITLSLLALGWIALTLLPAWPVAQAVSSKIVSPYRVLKATKGHRWSLFVVSFVAGSLNKMVPKTSTARNGGEAVLLALGNGFVSFITILVAVSIGVTAWRYGKRVDPSLQGDETRVWHI